MIESWVLRIWGTGCLLFVLGFVLGAFLLVSKPRKAWGYKSSQFLACLGCFAAGLAGCMVLSQVVEAGNTPPVVKPFTWQWFGLEGSATSGIPGLGFSIYLDGLAAFFTAVTGFIGLIVSIFSFRWLKGEPQALLIATFFNLFALATVLIFAVDNGFLLLVVLELSSLAFAVLVCYKGFKEPKPWRQDKIDGEDTPSATQAESRIALESYLVVSHIGTILILCGLLILLHHYGSLDFAQFRNAEIAELGEKQASICFILLFLGFGSRLGLVPFHFWVPLAHPHSPTTTHAFSLGIALKVGIYLMIRFFFGFLEGQVWWGMTVLLTGAFTALFTVFLALQCKDLKTGLAYHSVENIGLICSAVGLALIFTSLADRSLDLERRALLQLTAGLAMAGALFHTLNHALFKSLLYLATGSMEKRLGTVTLKSLGGVPKLLPITGWCFLLGSVAIAGLPPLNGFASEWLILEAFLNGALAAFDGQSSWAVGLSLTLALLMLSLAFAMTALAFIKFCGVCLFGPVPDEICLDDAPIPSKGFPRSREKKDKRMCFTQLILAAACVLLGMVPLWPLNLICLVSGEQKCSLVDLHAAGIWGLNLGKGTGSLLNVFPLWFLFFLVPALLILRKSALRKPWLDLRQVEEWGGGDALKKPGKPVGSSLVRMMSRFAETWHIAEGKINKEERPGQSHDQRQGLGQNQGHAQSLNRNMEQASLPLFFPQGKHRRIVEPVNQLMRRLLSLLMKGSLWLGNSIQNGDVRWYVLYVGAVVLILLSMGR